MEAFAIIQYIFPALPSNQTYLESETDFLAFCKDRFSKDNLSKLLLQGFDYSMSAKDYIPSQTTMIYNIMAPDGGELSKSQK